MHQSYSRRRFLGQVGVAAAGVAMPGVTARLLGDDTGDDKPRSRVIIARDDALLKGKAEEHGELMRKMLNASMQKLTGAADASAAWRQLFSKEDRVGLKVNCLGHTTEPVVVDAIVAGLREAGVPAENIIIWDRSDGELGRAGFKINKSDTGVKCYGTASGRRSRDGYQEKVETSGKIGSCFSRILAEQTNKVISVPVLKDHMIAGVSLSMKNFYGAIHNPNKYHGNQCDPYIGDIVAHRFIAPRWNLTVCDATTGQYNGGPMHRPEFGWSYGGMLVATDFVALDAVGADIIDNKRKEVGRESVADAGRPYKYIASAEARGLGVADLNRIDQIEV